MAVGVRGWVGVLQPLLTALCSLAPPPAPRRISDYDVASGGTAALVRQASKGSGRVAERALTVAFVPCCVQTWLRMMPQTRQRRALCASALCVSWRCVCVGAVCELARALGSRGLTANSLLPVWVALSRYGVLYSIKTWNPVAAQLTHFQQLYRKV